MAIQRGYTASQIAGALEVRIDWVRDAMSELATGGPWINQEWIVTYIPNRDMRLKRISYADAEKVRAYLEFQNRSVPGAMPPEEKLAAITET